MSPGALSVDEVRRALEAAARPEDAEPMAAYMRHQFSFLGAKTPAVRAAVKPLFPAAAAASAAELLAFVDDCWAQPEREFQSAGVTMLRRFVGKLDATDIDHLRRYLTTRSWWDTVDGLAAWVVGPLVAAEPALVETMDSWIESDNIWLARTAILHQLGYKERTDDERLFRYASLRAEDTEFFIRKAIGWALRQYARYDPAAVLAFVESNEARLSGLTKREALKHIER